MGGFEFILSLSKEPARANYGRDFTSDIINITKLDLLTRKTKKRGKVM